MRVTVAGTGCRVRGVDKLPIRRSDALFALKQEQHYVYDRTQSSVRPVCGHPGPVVGVVKEPSIVSSYDGV